MRGLGAVELDSREQSCEDYDSEEEQIGKTRVIRKTR